VGGYMRIESAIYQDWVEIRIIGEKKELARIELYHWNIMKELGLDIKDLLRVAFGGNG
jgi:hypothetical protein